MNTTINYLPNGDNDRSLWMINFNTKLPLYASFIGVTPAELVSVQNDTAMFNYILAALKAHKQTVISLTAYKNLMKHCNDQQHLGSVPAIASLPALPALIPEGVFDRISKLVKRIKTSINYTKHMGQDLGIIAPVKTVDHTVMKPVLKIKMKAGKPCIQCFKGVSDGIDLYVNRNDGDGFIYLNRLIKCKYTDPAPLPENVNSVEWSYKAMYITGNNQTGIMSAVTTLTVKKH